MSDFLKFTNWLAVRETTFDPNKAMFMRGDDVVAGIRKELGQEAGDKWEKDIERRRLAGANRPVPVPAPEKPPLIHIDPSSEPHPEQNPEMWVSGNSVEGKLNQLLIKLGQVDPQRAKWFAKVVSIPANAQKLKRLTDQITTVQDLLKLIGNLERRQRSRADTVVI